jgi:hypothetical protein
MQTGSMGVIRKGEEDVNLETTPINGRRNTGIVFTKEAHPPFFGHYSSRIVVIEVTLVDL